MLAVLVGCPSPAPGGADTTGEDTSAGPSSSSTTMQATTNPMTTDDSDPSTTGTSGSSDSTDGVPVQDVLTIPDMPIPSEEGCQAIDFLFIIDDSGSMYDEQVNLVANFPTFSTQIQKTLEHVTSYQVGVVATDAYSPNADPCGALGDLVISTVGGGDSSDMVCGPYEEGYNYMTEQDNLAEKFACAAQLGTWGDGYERPMEAMMNTLGDQNDGPGECNEGFIRDEALLVVVIMTDEADGPGDPEGTPSIGDPQVWYDAVVEAKGGIAENAAVLSFINWYAEEDEDPSPCTPLDTYSDGVNIKHFTQMFEENGFLGGLCLADYGPAFETALGVIDTACENFIPPN